MMDVSNFESNQSLANVMRNFFLQVPFKCLDQKVKEFAIQNAEMVFSHTFQHEMNLKYPLKRSYQVSFLKNLIQELEEKNEDVDENIYHYYLKLLEKTDEETHHIHYMISIDRFISIQQNTSAISDGTTGLSTWQAGKVLADYCVENTRLFEDKKVLELGCGVGLTGLAVIFACRPSYYCFTDIHEKVLNYLVNNIKLNVNSNDVGDAQNTYFECTSAKTKISVAKLPWGDLDSNFSDSFNPDVILAADVVYNSTLFHPFCLTVKGFIKRNMKVKILVACTVRNTTTLEHFFSVLHEYNLMENEITVITTWNSNFKDKCLVKIFSLCSTDEVS